MKNHSYHFPKNLLKYLQISLVLFVGLSSQRATSKDSESRIFKWTQPNGKKLVLRVIQEATYERVETMDGYTVVFNSTTSSYEYAELSDDGTVLIPTGITPDDDDLTPNGLTKGVEVDKKKPKDERKASMEVSNSTVLNASGFVGGPFFPNSIVYRLSNTSKAPLSWGVSKNSNWVNLSASSGNLPPETFVDITVSIGNAAGVLPVGLHDDTIVFTNKSNGVGNAIRSVSLMVNPLPTFTLNYSAGSGGTLSGQVSQIVNQGASGSQVIAIPDTGYRFSMWSDELAVASRTDNAVTRNLNVTAIFVEIPDEELPPENPLDEIELESNSDNDGFNNQQEFAFGTDPSSPTMHPLEFIPGGKVTKTGAPALRDLAEPGQPSEFNAVFTRRKDHDQIGLRYIVEMSADLIRWTEVISEPNVLTEDPDSSVEAVSVPFPETVPVEGNGPQRPPTFFRIGVLVE